MLTGITRKDGRMVIRMRGWYNVNVFHLRFYTTTNDPNILDYIDMYGFELGKFMLSWSNPFAPHDEVTPV